MTDDVAIRVENLSKCYPIFDKPRDRLKQMVLPRLGPLAGAQNAKYYREFWALKDVSFELKKGETFGIIGRNGSGKSTLLQIICGTLSPTQGQVSTWGRVAALLELGAGFNPEFTGRENVYMNASLFGLSDREIHSRFGKICEFADIGDFIDQPIKTYSSGMTVRLAFSVVAHVDPDILIIDEALAVGDAVFTQKCMRFIRSFQEDKTLIFVSHDMAAIQNLCGKAIWLSHGSIRGYGTARQISEDYLQESLQEMYGEKVTLTSVSSGSSAPLGSISSKATCEEMRATIDYKPEISVKSNTESARGWKTGVATIERVSLDCINHQRSSILAGGELVKLTIVAKTSRDMNEPIIGFLWQDRLGQTLFGENTLPITESKPKQIKSEQKFYAAFHFRLPLLPDGQYTVTATLAEGDRFNQIHHHWLHDALVVQIASTKIRWGLVGIPFESIILDSIKH
jgi:lipopolysaccharide transport system ATP-binding protein